MAECENLGKCPFFNATTTSLMPQLCEMLKERFCLTDNTGCARLAVRTALGPEYVPLVMTPFQMEWARQILAENSVPQDQWAL